LNKAPTIIASKPPPAPERAPRNAAALLGRAIMSSQWVVTAAKMIKRIAALAIKIQNNIARILRGDVSPRNPRERRERLRSGE
jgi:hypothetical protein